jgi:hypothetical protein
MSVGIVIGRAVGNFEQYALARELAPKAVRIAINVVGRDLPTEFEHWVSYHPPLFDFWSKARVSDRHFEKFNGLYWSGIYRGKKLGLTVDPRILKIHYVEVSGGSSGFLATTVGLKGLGLDRVILCGVPMDGSPRYEDPKGWHEYQAYRKTWEEAKESIAPYVRSYSGWTRELFGPPTLEWCESGK